MHWPGFRDDGALILPLDQAPFYPPDAPLRLRLDGQVLERKHELHMTLLGRDQGREAVEALGEARLRDLFVSLDWQPRGTCRYALLRKAKEQWQGELLHAWSVVEHLQAPAYARFRHELAQATGLALDSGVPHVTLYVAGDPYGIGVPGIEAYHQVFVREVIASELAPGPVLPRD